MENKDQNEKKSVLEESNFISAKLNRVIYPNKGSSSSNGFSVIDYICVDKKATNSLAIDENGNDLFGRNFKGTGFYLPDADIVYKLYGYWKDTKYGKTFEIERYEEIIEEDEAGIIHYLSTLDGVGPVLATRIYDKFEGDSLKILDEEPEKLMQIKGINGKKYENLIGSYNMKRAARDIVVKLAPLGFSTNQIYKLYEVYGVDTLNIIKDNPFIATYHIGFERANALSIQFGMPLFKRIVETMRYVLNSSISRGSLNTVQGSTFMKFSDLVIQTQTLLEVHITNEHFRKSINYLKDRGVVFDEYQGEIICYREEEYVSERSIANSISKLMRKEGKEIDVEEKLALVEEENFRLIGQQEEAVFKSLENNFSIITGGPGTGKTTIINFIVKVYKEAYPFDVISLLAPTGRAAKKMSESTGLKASTIHKALAITPLTVLGNHDVELTSDLLIVDETSMVDIHLAALLLNSVKPGAKVIFVGDVDQLPSIGPGSFLKDMIASERVPVTKLNKIYRVSNSQSNIITNANLIKHGQTDLDYTDNIDGDFRFVHASDFDYAQSVIIGEYMKAVKEVGIDEVCLLTPFRVKTPTGVDNINPLLQDHVNPSSSLKKEVKLGSRVFRVGDKVMETVNKEDIANGDIGYILAIDNADPKNIEFTIDFNDGQIVNYDTIDMQDVTLAYATTIHKSQGSEYKIVIINLMTQHSIMLKRNLIYTAITRAKDKCVLVGTKTAISQAIRDVSMQDRNTKLIERVQERIVDKQ